MSHFLVRWQMEIWRSQHKVVRGCIVHDEADHLLQQLRWRRFLSQSEDQSCRLGSSCNGYWLLATSSMVKLGLSLPLIFRKARSSPTGAFLLILLMYKLTPVLSMNISSRRKSCCKLHFVYSLRKCLDICVFRSAGQSSSFFITSKVTSGVSARIVRLITRVLCQSWQSS